MMGLVARSFFLLSFCVSVCLNSATFAYCYSIQTFQGSLNSTLSFEADALPRLENLAFLEQGPTGTFLSSAYPSPTSNIATFTYTLPAHIQNPTLKVYDMMGKVVHFQVLEQSSGEAEINVRNFNEGIYFYSLSHQGQVLATKKLIVTH
jgi:hypothetical protein